MTVSESNILVTGGGRGIGHFLSFGLLQQAKNIFLIDNDQSLLSGLEDHPHLFKYLCDITNPEAIEEVVDDIFKSHGGVNVCINNAGIIHNEVLVNILSRNEKRHSISNWEKVINVNLSAVFFVTANVVEKMIAGKQKGVIINISSISAQGNIGQSAYAASKAGVEALTKTWSKELGMFKIRCACIAPGFFNTPSTRESLNEHMLKKWEKSIPIGRLGELEDLLNAVIFIIQNDYFNGKVLSLDGGLTI